MAERDVKKKYNLKEIHADESAYRKYIRLNVGQGGGFLSLLAYELIFGLLTGLPTVLGIFLRSFFYQPFFSRLSKGSYFGKHVSVRCPRNIIIGENVLVDEFVQLFATSNRKDAIVIDNHVFVRSGVKINAGPPDGYIHIGSGCGIGQGTVMYGNGGLEIGSNVLIAGQCFIVASSHEFSDPNLTIADQGFSAKGIKIEDNVWIGAGVKILDGVTIGSGAIIGANAVVNRNVSPGDRVGGVPAKPLFKNSESVGC